MAAASAAAGGSARLGGSEGRQIIKFASPLLLLLFDPLSACKPSSASAKSEARLGCRQAATRAIPSELMPASSFLSALLVARCARALVSRASSRSRPVVQLCGPREESVCVCARACLRHPPSRQATTKPKPKRPVQIETQASGQEGRGGVARVGRRHVRGHKLGGRLWRWGPNSMQLSGGRVGMGLAACRERPLARKQTYKNTPLACSPPVHTNALAPRHP